MNECSICFNTIEQNIQYAKIDNPDETGKYHVHCLETWLKSSNNNGIMTIIIQHMSFLNINS